MATYTPNYNLSKPDASDNFGNFRQSYNDNMDKIDANLGGGGGSGDTVSWTQIQATGEKIAEITINGTTTDVLIPFEAKIIVTTTTGLTVTATKGGTTYTATETSTGVYEVTVDSKGTWTVTDGTNTTTVSVTAQTTYNVAFVVIPDGSTVTPTDDIQTWLNCANIWDKNYTTLAEVLADTTTLSALISSNNAVDYMVRSTTWAIRTDLVPMMTSNTAPSGVCSCSSVHSATYDAYKAFDKSKSTLWHANADTGVYPQTLTYEFPAAQTIRSASLSPWYFNNGCRERTYKYQGSNDGVTYVDLTETITYQGSQTATVAGNGYAGSDEIVSFTKNIGSYKYYQLVALSGDIAEHKAAVVELSFYDNDGTAIIPADSTAMTYIGLNNYCANKLLADATWRTAICTSAYKENVLNVKTPDMTGFNTPSGLVSASSNHPTYPNYYVAFNDYPTQIWVSPDNTTNQWLQYKFDNAVKVICFEIEVTFVIGGVEYARTSSLQLKGSADGNTFTFSENYSLPAGVKKLFVTTNNDSMAYWRMVVNGFNMHYNADNCLICIIRYYGREDV